MLALCGKCLEAERMPMNGVHPQMSRTHEDEGPKMCVKAHPESVSSGNPEPRALRECSSEKDR